VALNIPTRVCLRRSPARLFAAMLMVTALSAAAADYALIYNGPVAAEDCPEAVAAVAREAGLPVKYVSNLRKLPSLLDHAAVFIIGGTEDDLDPLIKGFSPSITQALQEYVRKGGRYLGICGGAYMAGTGDKENGRHVSLLNLIPAEPHEFDEGNYAEQIIPVRWQCATYPMYFQGGPAFALTPRSRGARVMAKYADGQIAALICFYGRGRVAVIGPHPEAPPDWVEGMGQAELWVSTRHLLVALVRELLAGGQTKAGNIAPDRPLLAR